MWDSAAKKSSPLPPSPNQVLLLEPCKMIRQVLQRALRSWGCGVCAVTSEEEAVQALVEAGSLTQEAAKGLLLSATGTDDPVVTDPPVHAMQRLGLQPRPQGSGGEQQELCLMQSAGGVDEDQQLNCQGK